jgi:hypothetical protein
MEVVSPSPQLQVVPEMSTVIGVESARTRVAESRTTNATASFTFIVGTPKAGMAVTSTRTPTSRHRKSLDNRSLSLCSSNGSPNTCQLCAIVFSFDVKNTLRLSPATAASSEATEDLVSS